MILKKIKKVLLYFLKKTPELLELDEKDLLLAKVVLDIHRKRTHSNFVIVPLYALHQIHPIDNRKTSLEQTEERARIIAQHKTALLAEKRLTRETLVKYLPPVSGIKVVRESAGNFISFEGNGRLVALQKVFTPQDDIEVEVEEYYFKNTKKILRRMNRVRRRHELIK